jgi:serine/threonine-protein kinase OSR1/STK39
MDISRAQLPAGAIHRLCPECSTMAQQETKSQAPSPPVAATNAEWVADATAYEFIGKIGQGAFASVWRARGKHDGRECAVKVINLDHVDSNLSEIRLEVQAMRLSSHANVLACHTAFVNNTNLWLVAQLMRKGSSLHCLQGARRILKSQQKVTCMEDHILYIIHETLLGLQYIHDNGLIHRDIKAGNILLDGNGDVRIADFGVSGWLINAGKQQEKAKTFVGTPCWMAPEVMEQIHGYDYKADIWSLGITALELAKGYAPYAKYPPMKVLILTIQEEPPSLDSYDEEHGDDCEADKLQIVEEEWSKSFRALVDTCLQKNPAKRPKSEELLQTKYLNALQDPSHRQARRQAITTQVCDLVVDVGSTEDWSQNEMSSRLPGNAPVSIVLSSEENRPAGTTWVFADGSEVLASTSTSTGTLDDVLAQFDEHCHLNGGVSGVGSGSGATAGGRDSGESESCDDEFGFGEGH